MNVSTLIGLICATAFFVAALVMSSDNYGVYWNLNAVVIVAGGTGASTLLCFSLPKVAGLIGVVIRRWLGRNRRNYLEIIEDLGRLARAKRAGTLSTAKNQMRDLFLRDAADILEWGEAEISSEQLRDLLETRAETFYTRYMKEAAIFKTISKFPPAFGLLGTTLGMIALLQSLGTSGSQNTIGPAMGVALVATLYGIVAANLIFVPISENLQAQTEEDNVARLIVVEGAMMIHEGLPTRFIEEKAKSFLLPNERAGGAQAA